VPVNIDHARQLTTISVFQNLPEEALRRLLRASTFLEPRTGTQLFARGDQANAIYAILNGEGYVRVGAADRRSKSLMFGIFRKGELFGELGVIEGRPRTADAVTEGRLSLCRIAGSGFMSVLEEFPSLGASLCRILAEKLRRTSLLLEDASFETLEVRLARQLLYLASRHGYRVESGVRLGGRFRQSDLADLLGATTRSIITILNSWRSLGILSFDPAGGRLTITGETQLRALLSEE
jgi:CRP/FNR family cyclic AMP-dependent transcriptional regulator